MIRGDEQVATLWISFLSAIAEPLFCQTPAQHIQRKSKTVAPESKIPLKSGIIFTVNGQEIKIEANKN